MNTRNNTRGTNNSDLDEALAQAAWQVELARQEHLFLQQEHNQLRIRQRLVRERETEQRDRDRPRNEIRASAPSQTQREDRDPGELPPSHIPTSSSAQQPNHPVFLLSCKGCGTLLSDRGMKAILLLKPHVTLYSTDVMPSNVGPIYSADASHERSLTRSPSSSVRRSQLPVQRTCDCLTETLGCYGCGAQVGYHIISPCIRCTATVTDEKCGSNGHRTVLHCGEITARERRYYPGEAGVRCAPTPIPFSERSSNNLRRSSSNGSRRGQPTSDWSRGPPLGRDNAPSGSGSSFGGRNTRSVQTTMGPFFYSHSGANYRSTQETGLGDLSDDEDGDEFLDLDLSPETEGIDVDGYEYDLMGHDKFYIGGAGRLRAISTASQPRFQNQLHRRAVGDGSASRRSGKATHGPPARLLKRGEVVYWGDLVPGGERCRPFDSDAALQMPTAIR